MVEFIECKKCGNLVPSVMKSCPHCGNDDLTPAVDEEPVQEASEKIKLVEQKETVKKTSKENFAANSEKREAAPTRKIGAKAAETKDFSANRKIGKYTLTRLLGKGGFGEVWEVSTNLTPKLALKIIPLSEDTDPSKMIREYKLLRKVNDFSNLIRYENPELVKIDERDYLLIPMNDVMAGDLDDFKQSLRNKTFAEKERILFRTILPQICSGLKALQDAGIAHLDIKPGNILYSGTNFKLADFGAASVFDSMLNTMDVTSEHIIGTAFYMSPEQKAGKKCDIRSDIFSLGVTLCMLLFDEPYTVEGPGVSSSLIKFLNKFTANSPTARFQTIDEILAHSNDLNIKDKPRQQKPQKPSSESDQLKQFRKMHKQSGKVLVRVMLIMAAVLIAIVIALCSLDPVDISISSYTDVADDNGASEILEKHSEAFDALNSSENITQEPEINLDVDESVLDEESLANELLCYPEDFTNLSAKEIVKRYLEVTAWEQRLSYVLYPELVKPLMKEAYKNAVFLDDAFEYENDWRTFKLVTADELNGPPITDVNTEVVIFIEKELRKLDFYEMMDTDYDSYGSLSAMWVLKHTEYGWRIDWVNSGIPDSPVGEQEVRVERPESLEKAADIFAFIRLDDFYGYQFSGKEDDFYPFEMYITGGEMFEEVHGYIDRNAADGKLLYQIVKKSKWPLVPVSLKCAYITRDSRNEYDTDHIDIVSFEHTYFY